jgi:hypothetical protein
MKREFGLNYFLLMCIGSLLFSNACAQQDTVSIDWNTITFVSKTTPTLQLVENPMVRPSSPIHKKVFSALQDLKADYVRYVPWFPYPKMAVAELKPPTAKETFWDFTYLDSTMEAFMNATKGHSVIVNFSTTPAWMWTTDNAVSYPDNPYQVSWDYNQGNTLRDTTMKEIADYYGRLFSWYTRGGFTDELGVFHQSNHFYKIPYWEVLNEPDFEHYFSPQSYTKIYDAIVAKLKKISPSTKFIGLAVAFNNDPNFFEYFLNPKNHKPNIPLDGISYHFYGTPLYQKQSPDKYYHAFFEQANAFLVKVRYIENIRKRLSPKTMTTIDEIGTIINANSGNDIPENYWNESGSMYAYVFLELTKMGIDVAGESQLVGYPSQFPDVTMIDWENGNPNARYWILKLLKENFGPGDKLVKTSFSGGGVFCQAFITTKGKKLLLINYQDKAAQVNLPGAIGNGAEEWVDGGTGENPPSKAILDTSKLTLNPFAVAVLELR